MGKCASAPRGIEDVSSIKNLSGGDPTAASLEPQSLGVDIPIKNSSGSSFKLPTRKKSKEKIETHHPNVIRGTDESEDSKSVKPSPPLIPSSLPIPRRSVTFATTASDNSTVANSSSSGYLNVPSCILSTLKNSNSPDRPRPPHMQPFSPFGPDGKDQSDPNSTINPKRDVSLDEEIAELDIDDDGEGNDHDQWRFPKKGKEKERIEVDISSIRFDLPLPNELDEDESEQPSDRQRQIPTGMPFLPDLPVPVDKESPTDEETKQTTNNTKQSGIFGRKIKPPELKRIKKIKPASYRVQKMSDESRPTTASDGNDAFMPNIQNLQQALISAPPPELSMLMQPETQSWTAPPPQKSTVIRNKEAQQQFEELNRAQVMETQGAFAEELIEYVHSHPLREAGELVGEEHTFIDDEVILDPVPGKEGTIDSSDLIPEDDEPSFEEEIKDKYKSESIQKFEAMLLKKEKEDKYRGRDIPNRPGYLPARIPTKSQVGYPQSVKPKSTIGILSPSRQECPLIIEREKKELVYHCDKENKDYNIVGKPPIQSALNHQSSPTELRGTDESGSTRNSTKESNFHEDKPQPPLLPVKVPGPGPGSGKDCGQSLKSLRGKSDFTEFARAWTYMDI